MLTSFFGNGRTTSWSGAGGYIWKLSDAGKIGKRETFDTSRYYPLRFPSYKSSHWIKQADAMLRWFTLLLIVMGQVNILRYCHEDLV